MRRAATCALLVAAIAAPAAGSRQSADAQSAREVTASARVTMTARPTALRWAQGATLFGTVESGRADEEVTIQARDCGQKSFTNAAAILTHQGGTWTTQFGRGINTTIRAVWKDAVSATVELRQQPNVQLLRRSAKRFEVAIASKGQFWRKRVLVQRRTGGSWKTLKTVVLTETHAPPGTGTTWTEAEFRLSVPRGSILRAQLPLSQARPCFLPSTSATVRT